MPCFNEKLLDEEKNYQYIVPKKKSSEEWYFDCNSFRVAPTTFSSDRGHIVRLYKQAGPGLAKSRACHL